MRMHLNYNYVVAKGTLQSGAADYYANEVKIRNTTTNNNDEVINNIRNTEKLII